MDSVTFDCVTVRSYVVITNKSRKLGGNLLFFLVKPQNKVIVTNDVMYALLRDCRIHFDE